MIFVHPVSLCSQMQPFTNFPHFLAFFSGTTGLHLDQTLIFVYDVALCSHLQCFQIFFTFLHISQELLIWSWSNFDFCLCFGTLQPIVKFQNFLTFWHLSEELLVFIKLWFLFMLWHSADSCKVSQISQFCHFSQELLIWSWSNFDFCSCCKTLQPIAMFPSFPHFLHFSQELLVWSWSNFDFCLCFGCQISKFSSLFCIFLRNYWSDLDQTLIFVHAVSLCS